MLFLTSTGTSVDSQAHVCMSFEIAQLRRIKHNLVDIYILKIIDIIYYCDFLKLFCISQMGHNTCVTMLCWKPAELEQPGLSIQFDIAKQIDVNTVIRSNCFYKMPKWQILFLSLV